MARVLYGDIYIDPAELEFVSELGEGEYAIVEKGRLRDAPGSPYGGTPVTVKSYKPSTISTPEDLRELVIEAQKLSKFKHKNLCQFRQLGCYLTDNVDEVRNSVFFTEEYVGTYSFKKLIQEQARHSDRRIFQTRDALRWLSHLAEGLDFLHTQDPAYIHGDVKSDNVFIQDGIFGKVEAKLADLKPHRHVYDRAVNQAQVRVSRPSSKQQVQSTLARYSVRASAELSRKSNSFDSTVKVADVKSNDNSPAPGSRADGTAKQALDLPANVRQKLSSMPASGMAASQPPAAAAAAAAAMPTPAAPPKLKAQSADALRPSTSAPSGSSGLTDDLAKQRAAATQGVQLLSISVPNTSSHSAQVLNSTSDDSTATSSSTDSSASSSRISHVNGDHAPAAQTTLPSAAADAAAGAAADAAAAGAASPVKKSALAMKSAFQKSALQKVPAEVLGAPTIVAPVMAVTPGTPSPHQTVPTASASIAIPKSKARRNSLTLPMPIHSSKQHASSFHAGMLLGSQEQCAEDVPVRGGKALSSSAPQSENFMLGSLSSQPSLSDSSYSGSVHRASYASLCSLNSSNHSQHEAEHSSSEPPPRQQQPQQESQPQQENGTAPAPAAAFAAPAADAPAEDAAMMDTDPADDQEAAGRGQSGTLPRAWSADAAQLNGASAPQEMQSSLEEWKNRLAQERSEGDHGYKMSRSHTMPALHTAEGGEHKQHGSSSALEALIAIDSIQEEESITGDSTVMGDTTADEASGSCSPSHSSNTLRNSLERKRAVKPLFQRKVTFNTEAAATDKTSGRMWNMLYMAPEVVKAQKLTEKVDVFAFGIVMYELLTRSLLTVYLTGDDETEDDALVAYATRVADGFREEIPQAWPPEVRQLVRSCWAQEPMMRPRMGQVARILQQWTLDCELMEKLDPVLPGEQLMSQRPDGLMLPPEGPGCGCVIS